MSTVIILAGGLGTRLRPYTVVLPKPLMPIGETPILEIIFKQLVKHGFKHCILAVNHQANLLQTYFGDGGRLGINITYSLEKKRLGTMGPVRMINNLPNNFLIMNGDILCDLNYSKLLKSHTENNSKFTISASEREHKIDYGVLNINEDSFLTGFEEKPTSKYLVSMGVYCMNRSLLELIPEDQYFGFDNLMLELIKRQIKVDVKKHKGYWLDIGRPDDYYKALEEWPNIQNSL